MFALSLVLINLSAAMAWMSLGGGFYEYLVVDPFWPQRPDLIQPTRGGISRRRFWIPAHTVFELLLVASVVVTWREAPLRTALLTALASHAVMRLWSAFDFIPKALAFEKADVAAITPAAARRWSRRSLWRLPLDLMTCCALFVAVVHSARLF